MGVSKLQTFTFQELQDFPGISSFDFAVSPEFMTALCAGPSLSPRKVPTIPSTTFQRGKKGRVFLEKTKKRKIQLVINKLSSAFLCGTSN